ncbi:hypothetical protein LNQ82_07975 [Conchiformibius steedae DSM 2580]|uniref:Uncharacterized protein n=2 Tax=Conchiformibius steedae TaxID=153493 RepID=A0A3P2A341_9NEIS|nr:hypothetical protein [Conchiformibius steedae]QMT34343.1 hypothetical protein H3L98_05070 [Conchiformibius steedae]RRD89847.1 hypothetical protein EII21_07365 [Conchiformibius steedae]URD67121.1 hypothetical protein LNQ82_07975 [Conchiformibius steedae DSM 2580]
MTSSVKLPPVPAKRYFSLEEVCRLACIKPAQLAEWQRQNGSIGGHGGSRFTRLDVMKIRQLQHGIADVFSHDGLDSEGNPAIGADEMRGELTKMLAKIEKTLAN